MEFKIEDYVLDHTKDGAITERMISDYNEDKDSSYINFKWLQDVAYHNNSDNTLVSGRIMEQRLRTYFELGIGVSLLA